MADEGNPGMFVDEGSVPVCLLHVPCEGPGIWTPDIDFKEYAAPSGRTGRQAGGLTGKRSGSSDSRRR